MVKSGDALQFEQTNAKSWSVVSALPGTPSPAMFAAVTVTAIGPEVPAGRNTAS